MAPSFAAVLAFVILLAVNIGSPVHSTNVLCLLGAPHPADELAHRAWWHDALLPELARAGHNLTVLSALEPVQSAAEYGQRIHYVRLPAAPRVKPATPLGRWSPQRLWNGTVYERIVTEFSAVSALETLLVDAAGIRELLAYPDDFRFDAILYDPHSGANVLLGFVQRFGNAPLVAASAATPSDGLLWRLAGAEVRSAHMAHRWSAYDAFAELSFVERARNWSYDLFEAFYGRFVYMRNANRKARAIFGESVWPLQDIEAQTDLVLCSWAFGVDRARSLPPNVRAVGGLQAQRRERSPIGRQLRTFLERSAGRKLVYVNLGARLSDEQRRLVAAALTALHEHRFVWYTEQRRLNYLPGHIFSTGDRLPQSELLSQHNVSLVVTNGGRRTVQEALWNAIPMLGVYRTSEERAQLNRPVHANCARAVPLDSLGAEQLRSLVDGLLNDEQFIENAHKMQRIVYGSRLSGPLEEAVHSVSSVVRVGNARHWQLRLNHLSAFQLQLFDVSLAFAVLAAAFLAIFVRNCCVRRKPQADCTDGKVKSQ